MHVVTEKNGRLLAADACEIALPITPLAKKILLHLAKGPAYPKQIAIALGVHEQKVYYHVRILARRGFIRLVRREVRGGMMASIYALTAPAYVARFGEFVEYRKVPRTVPSFLRPFIEAGELNARIIVGSPDPHGPEHARSRDAYLAVDVGLFLGTFLATARPAVTLDTDVRHDDLANNLIIIGGPVINRVTKQVNDSLPVRFDARKYIVSSLTKKTYRTDETGLIVKCGNPFAKNKKLLVIAGRRYAGTRAALLAFTQRFDELATRKRECAVVEGIDEDGDGIVDSVKILE